MHEPGGQLVSAEPTLPHAQLLVYEFGPNANFEGRIVGALERGESGGTLRILDAAFVGRDAQTGELVATDITGDAAGSRVASLPRFRLEPAERRRATERTLARGAIPPDSLHELARWSPAPP